MPGSQSVDDIYVSIRLEASQLRSDLRKIPPDAEKIAKDVEGSFKRLRIDISNRLLKMKFSEIQQLHKALTQQLERKIQMNANLASIEKTRTALRQVEQALGGVKAKSEQVEKTSKISFAGFVTSAIVGYFAVTRLVGAIGSLLRESIESAKAQALIETSVKATGYAAGFTATQLQKVAHNLQELTGISDEDILLGVTNQLLSFTHLTTENFQRATKAVLDLNAKINQGDTSSLKSQAIILGKALENPIVGMGMLARSGVIFSDIQKRQIRNYIQQNDLVSAQNLILSEIEKKYGGQAQALNEATKGTKDLGVAWDDMKESLGDLFGPLLEKWLPALTKATKGWISILNQGKNSSKEFQDGLKELELTSKEITLNELKNSTAESRMEMKKFNDEQIQSNQDQWKVLKSHVQVLKDKANEQGYLNNADFAQLKSYENQQIILNKSSALLKGQNNAIDEIDGTLAKLNDKWISENKTIGEIQDRITDLQDALVNLSPDLDAGKIKEIEDEIARLNKKIETGEQAKADLIELTLKKIENQLELETLLNKSKLETLQTSKATLEALLKTTSKEEDRLKILKEINQISGEIKTINDEILAGGTGRGKTPEEVFQNAANPPKSRDQLIKDREIGIERILDAEKEIIDLRLKAIPNEYTQRVAAINSEYDFLLEKYQKLSDDKLISEDKFNEAVGNIEKAREMDLAQVQADRYAAAYGAVRTIANALSQALGDTTLVRNMQKALEIAEAIAAVLQAINILGSIFGGGGGAAAAALKSGGEFYRGKVTPYSKIPKFASGTDFKVPGKFRNDSYLMRVSANERVRVTPANRVGETDALLSVIANRIGVLNRNVQALELGVQIINQAPDVQTQVRKNKRVESRLQRNGINFTEQE